MITTKKVAKWLWTEFKREMVIQKPDAAMLARMEELRVAPVVRKKEKRIAWSQGLAAIFAFPCTFLLVAIFIL